MMAPAGFVNGSCGKGLKIHPFTKSAHFGAGSLPRNVAVEVEAVFEVE